MFSQDLLLCYEASGSFLLNLKEGRCFVTNVQFFDDKVLVFELVGWKVYVIESLDLVLLLKKIIIVVDSGASFLPHFRPNRFATSIKNGFLLHCFSHKLTYFWNEWEFPYLFLAFRAWFQFLVNLLLSLLAFVRRVFSGKPIRMLYAVWR